MKNEVNKDEFWKQRLEEAEGKGDRFLSVYNTNRPDWDYICQVHKKICDHFVSGRVLDVGCGYGRSSEWFLGEYIGTDFSETFIKKAKELYPNRVFIQADAKDLPFGDKEFDWAICVSLKRMVQRELGDVEWMKMEKEIKRVAKNVLILEYSNPQDYQVL